MFSQGSPSPALQAEPTRGSGALTCPTGPFSDSNVNEAHYWKQHLSDGRKEQQRLVNREDLNEQWKIGSFGRRGEAAEQVLVRRDDVTPH